MRTKSSPAKKKKTAPATQEPEAHDPSEMQLQIVESSPSSPMSRSPIKLPGGWVVEQRPRVTSAGHPGRVDRYYYEPGSGRQFRSLIAVHKYLSQEMDYTLANATQGQRVKPRDYESMQIVPHSFKSATPFKLPHDWTVEEKPRSNINYAGVVDRYYIEPGTGHRFRSLRAVERYLAEMEARAAASKNSSHIKYICAGDSSLQIALPPAKGSSPSSSGKKQKSVVEVDPMLDFTSPPAKVKWVLGGRSGSMWNPFLEESVVPEFIQQTWSETFILSIQDQF